MHKRGYKQEKTSTKRNILGRRHIQKMTYIKKIYTEDNIYKKKHIQRKIYKNGYMGRGICMEEDKYRKKHI